MSQENHSPIKNNNNNKPNRGKNKSKQSPLSNKTKLSPLTTMNNGNDGFTKLKPEEKKRKRKQNNDQLTMVDQQQQSRDDEDVFTMQGYTTAPPLLSSRSKNPIQAYGKNKTVTRPRPSNFFDQSQDNEDVKCAKCENYFAMELFKEHTNVCLNDSITIT